MNVLSIQLQEGVFYIDRKEFDWYYLYKLEFLKFFHYIARSKLFKESKPDGNAATGLVEKKAGPPGGLGKLLENKKGGAEGGLPNALGKKAGFGQLLNKNLGNAAEKKGGGSFGNILDKKGGGASALGKMNFGPFGKRGMAKPGKGDDEHGILEGISSLHSWIKSQTMIKPNQKLKGKHAALYDEVNQIFSNDR